MPEKTETVIEHGCSVSCLFDNGYERSNLEGHLVILTFLIPTLHFILNTCGEHPTFRLGDGHWRTHHNPLPPTKKKEKKNKKRSRLSNPV